MRTSQEFHEEVQGIKPKRDRLFFATLYLTAGRISEVVGLRDKGGVLRTPGILGEDVKVVPFHNNDVLEITVNTAKRKKAPLRREVGVPLDEKLEPFSKMILTHAETKKPKQPLFSFTRKWGYVLVRKQLPWLYKMWILDRRDRYRLNPWRSLRLRHLRKEWYFQDSMLNSYAGWTRSDMGPVDEYVTGDWLDYIHLFFERSI